MFELSIALKYLLPKRRQLSVSIISLISILVISLVVWLILVFFSVTRGLEAGWVEKLITLTAPVRVTPTENYFRSYDYQIDLFSAKSEYRARSLGEKRESPDDPYNPLADEALPEDFPKPLLIGQKNIPLAKTLFQAIDEVPNTTVSEYEVAASNLRLRLVRGLSESEPTQSFLSQSIYLGTFEGDNPAFAKTFVPFRDRDLKNTLLLAASGKGELQDLPGLEKLSRDESVKREKALSERLKQPLGSKIPSTIALDQLNRLFKKEGEEAPFFALFRTDKGFQLPFDTVAGYGVLAPKSFRDAGVLLGDRGYLSYFAPSVSSLLEQRVPIFIAGFYDPGIVPLGGKFLLADPALVKLIRSASQQEATPMTNGVNIRLASLSASEAAKAKLIQALKEKGIDSYFKVETYRDFDYAKDLLQQLRSEKNIFTLISIVIMLVACSNIISMLIILVNDKKTEIGILRSMGASSTSIAMIFGVAGAVMGLFGTLFGTFLAYLTLSHLNELLRLISKIQGYDAFNPVFYGEKLPETMSFETLFILMGATVALSLIAGLIPAIKASRMDPARILRAE